MLDARLPSVTTAMYPGSFDPFHLGHLVVVTTACELFDDVLVAVLANPDKPTGLLAADERVRLVQSCTQDLAKVRCRAFYGLTVDLAREEQVDVLVRAAHRDTQHERVMAAMNTMAASIETFFVPPDPATWTISSSTVRELLAAGEIDAAATLVPTPVAEVLRSITAVI